MQILQIENMENETCKLSVKFYFCKICLTLTCSLGRAQCTGLESGDLVAARGQYQVLGRSHVMTRDPHPHVGLGMRTRTITQFTIRRKDSSSLISH